LRHPVLSRLYHRQRKLRIAPPPLEQSRSRKRDPHIVCRFRLEPREEAVGGCDRTPPDQTLRHQEACRRHGLALGKASCVSKSAPTVGASSAAKAVAAKRQPVGRVHRRVAAAKTADHAGMKMHQADHVEPVVLEGRLQQGTGTVTQELEVGVGNQRAGDRVVSLVAK